MIASSFRCGRVLPLLSRLPLQSCLSVEGYVGNSDDCDDEQEEIHPDAEEICDYIIDIDKIYD